MEYNFDPPYKTPAAINMDIPPSIGIQGGGQHAAPPVGGGGGGAEKHEIQVLKINKPIIFIFDFINN